jgi:hypothetical protein
MINDNDLKKEDKKSGENAEATGKENTLKELIEKDQQSAEEESDLEQQRKEALTERD